MLGHIHIIHIKSINLHEKLVSMLKFNDDMRVGG